MQPYSHRKTFDATCKCRYCRRTRKRQDRRHLKKGARREARRAIEYELEANG